MIKKIKNIFGKKEKKPKKNFTNNEFYSIIKLISGEEILSFVMLDENDDDPILLLQNPIVIKMIPNNQGIIMKVKPWIEMSNDDIYLIRMDKIITMTETTDQKLIEIYKNYVYEENDSIDVYQPSGQVKPSPKMGYISSVEDARKKLEKLYKA